MREQVLVATMREAKEEQELQWAASNIQKVFRGKKQRDADKARREVLVARARNRGLHCLARNLL